MDEKNVAKNTKKYSTRIEKYNNNNNGIEYLKYDETKTETLDDIKFLNELVDEVSQNNTQNIPKQILNKPNNFVGKYVNP